MIFDYVSIFLCYQRAINYTIFEITWKILINRILYIKKSAKGMEQEHTYYFNKNSLSAFENQIKTKKSTFNESFKLNDGSILDYSVSSKKIN